MGTSERSRIRRQTARPSRPGSIRSSSTTSKRCRRAASRPRKPSLQRVTTTPWLSRYSAVRRASRWSSSTSRAVMVASALTTSSGGRASPGPWRRADAAGRASECRGSRPLRPPPRAATPRSSSILESTSAWSAALSMVPVCHSRRNAAWTTSCSPWSRCTWATSRSFTASTRARCASVTSRSSSAPLTNQSTPSPPPCPWPCLPIR